MKIDFDKSRKNHDGLWVKPYTGDTTPLFLPNEKMTCMHRSLQNGMAVLVSEKFPQTGEFGYFRFSYDDEAQLGRYFRDSGFIAISGITRLVAVTYRKTYYVSPKHIQAVRTDDNGIIAKLSVTDASQDRWFPGETTHEITLDKQSNELNELLRSRPEIAQQRPQRQPV